MRTQRIELPDADLLYNPGFLEEDEANFYFNQLWENTNWRQDRIKLFGKEHLQPRLTALYAEDRKSYTYSGLEMQPETFTPGLLRLKIKVEEFAGHQFTSCLVNLYRSGKDSMGWHADDEKELGKNPVIASISLGAERVFHFRHKTDKKLKHKVTLKHGSLLLMQGATQHFWKHQLPKTAKPIGPRINLTFRKIT